MYSDRLYHYTKSVSMRQICRFRTSFRQNYYIFYSIPIVIMICSIGFTELRATILNNLHGFDELWTTLASPIESRVLRMQAQPGVSLAVPWRLRFVMCYALASPRKLCHTLVYSAYCCVTQWPNLGCASFVASSDSV